MHHIEHGMSPKEATLKAMEEVSGPVIAIALILAAVFVPVGFMGGITGRLYQQFAITIAISVLLSAVNALTLSPALSALLLKPPTGKKTLLTPFYNGFNKIFGKATNGYIGVTTILARKFVVGLVLIVGLSILTVRIVARIPAGFVPEEDQGYVLVNALLPDAASLERTDAVMRKAEAILAANHAVEGYNTVTGYSLLTSAYSSNIGFFFVALKPWEERHSRSSPMASSPRSIVSSPGRSRRALSSPSVRLPSRAWGPARALRWSSRIASGDRRSIWANKPGGS
jgi:HAE1 family hydrophobic/amphiphilic exporter-1